MPGPTTEALNDEIKELRGDFHRSQLEIRDDPHRVQAALSADQGRLEVAVAELRTQLVLTTRVAVWGITFIAGTLITSTASGIWWASKMNTKVDVLESRFDKLESRFDKLDSRFGRLESRFDTLESSIAKILEQTRPK